MGKCMCLHDKEVHTKVWRDDNGKKVSGCASEKCRCMKFLPMDKDDEEFVKSLGAGDEPIPEVNDETPVEESKPVTEEDPYLKILREGDKA